MKEKAINTIKVYDWDDNSTHKIAIYRLKTEKGYRIDVDGAFWYSAEIFSEIYEEINKTLQLYNWKIMPLL